jgi:hypothetical protein
MERVPWRGSHGGGSWLRLHLFRVWDVTCGVDALDESGRLLPVLARVVPVVPLVVRVHRLRARLGGRRVRRERRLELMVDDLA